MPTYELRCESCGERFERFLTRLLREEDKCCPVCGSDEVRAGVGGGVVSLPAKQERSGCAPGGGFS